MTASELSKPAPVGQWLIWSALGCAVSGFFFTQTGVCAPLLSHLPKPERVLLIVSDDQGYGSMNAYGAPPYVIKTPHLDRLAKEGVRFTRAYAAGAYCSPTRYSILTGRYFWRTAYKSGHVVPPGAPLSVEPNRTTIATIMRQAGYKTAAVGKWHIGFGSAENDWNGEIKPGPLEVGFDYYFGFPENIGHAVPSCYIENRAVFGKIPGSSILYRPQRTGRSEEAFATGIEDPYIPSAHPEQVMELLTRKALAWLEKNKSYPFFLYFAPNALHEPITPSGRFKNSPAGPYGNFISDLDWSVGELLAFLERNKLADDTLILFISDNGGVVKTPLSQQAERAGLSINGGLRGSKGCYWEGGVRVPCLARWPKAIVGGRVCSEIFCSADFLATLAALTAQSIPNGMAEDSVDQSSVLLGNRSGSRKYVITQSGMSAFSIADKKWKLVEGAHPDRPSVAENFRRYNLEKYQIPKWFGRFPPPKDALYDLENDSTETDNVAANHPEVVRRLKTELVKIRGSENSLGRD